jgi:hypothetical protein
MPHKITTVSKCQYVFICLVCTKTKGSCLFSAEREYLNRTCYWQNTMDFDIIHTGGRNRMHPESLVAALFRQTQIPFNHIIYINVLNKWIIVQFICTHTWRKIYNPIPLSTVPWLSNRLNDTRVESRQGQKTLIFSETPGPRLQPTQHPVKWAPGLFTRLSRPQREVSRAPQSSVEVQNEWSYTCLLLLYA